jgi:hypothetical protein
MSNANTAATTFPTTKTGARRFLQAALEKVESASIRAWASSDHNRPILENEALLRLQAGRNDPTNFATAIVCHAIGL